AAAARRLVLKAVRVRGTELRFLERGAGIPVVFVHGSLGTFDTWRQQVDTFARHFRVITYSRRSHPPNPAPAGSQPYSLALHAEDLIAFVETLGLERVHLVGTSYGAFVALRVTVDRPDLVRSLVLAEPPILPWLGRTPEGDSLRRAFEAAALVPARRAFARGDSTDALRRFVDGVMGQSGWFDGRPAEMRAALLRLALEFSLEMRADPAVYLPALDCPDVGRIRNSVLLVTGQRSARMFHIITDELARCLRNEDMATVPGAGHAMHADQPAYYNAVVLRFLLRN
ncbi:MAG: alpha/beta fold hydrolase, partial [Gemmatimonadales bacterium]